MASARSQVYPQNDGERLTALEQCMHDVERRVEDMDSKMDTRFDELSAEIRGFAKTADEKYANKLVERIVYGMVAVTALAVLYAILNLVGLS